MKGAGKKPIEKSGGRHHKPPSNDHGQNVLQNVRGGCKLRAQH